MRRKIDQLLVNGQEDAAIHLIEEVWEIEAQKVRAEEIKFINQLTRKLNGLERRSKIENSNDLSKYIMIKK